MRNNLLIIAIVFSFGSLMVFNSCSKSSSSSSTPTRTQLLSKAAWKLDTSGIDLDKDGGIDAVPGFTVTIPACQKDNTYLFNKDSTGVLDEGPTKCNASDPQSTVFTWYLSNNQTVLNGTINASFGSGSLGVFSMTDTKMVLYKDTSYQGQKFWYILSLKH
jgi:hypothetical protein